MSSGVVCLLGAVLYSSMSFRRIYPGMRDAGIPHPLSCHSSLPLSFHTPTLSFQRMLESHCLTYTRSRDTPGMTDTVHPCLFLSFQPSFVIPAYAGISHALSCHSSACWNLTFIQGRSRDTPGMTLKQDLLTSHVLHSRRIWRTCMMTYER
jgi:hypothetical protein